MKRLLMLVLTLCLVTGGMATAEDGSDALRILDGWRVNHFQEMYPDHNVQEIKVVYDDDGFGNKAELLMSGDWDVAYFHETEYDLAKLAEAVPLLDLSTEAVYAQKLSQIYPNVQEAVTKNDQMLALPVWLDAAVMQMEYVGTVITRNGEMIDLGEQLGIAADEIPTTFSELCDLGVKYMALPRETRKGTSFNAFITEQASNDSKHFYLDYLVELYASEVVGENGVVNFDTPLFRTSLEDLDRLHTALKSDPKRTYGEKRTLYSVVTDASTGFLQDDILHLRVADGEQIPARLGVLVINANTKHKAEALDYLEFLSSEFMMQFGPVIYEVFDYDAAVRQTYDLTIEAQQTQEEEQSVIDELIRMRDAGDTSRFYSLELIDAYRQNIAPNLTFHVIPRPYTYNMTKDYAYGKVTADELVEKLNAAYQDAMK